MALTIPPPAGDTLPGVGSFTATPLLDAEQNCTVVALRGEADVSAGQALSDVLSQVTASRSGDVVIDLSQTTFIDTAIVRILSDERDLVVRQGNTLTFRSPSRLAARLLEVFGLTDLIEFREPTLPG
jgi:anti-anti-sigma factor